MRCRGQSEVLGFILLLGLVTAGVTGIVVLGSEAVSDTRQSITSGTAEHAMTQFDSKASLVAHGDSSSQSATLAGSSSATRTVDTDRGWMNVTIRNESDSDQIEAQLMNVTLGAVVYEDGETTIAYQGGGVWRSDTGGSQMVSPPEFHYRGTTLTLPLVTVDGDGSVNEDVQITQNGPSENVYPNGNYSNPLEDGKIVVEVHSEFYTAWGRFFTERTGGEVEIDHGNETATITLVTPAETEPVGAALSSSAAGDELEFTGGGNNGQYVDNYNSSDGNYTDTKSNNGTVKASGDITLGGNAEIHGHLRSGGTISMQGTPDITGTSYWTTGFNVKGNGDYPNEAISGVSEAEDMSGFVRNRLDSLEAENDNAASTGIRNEDGEHYFNFSDDDTAVISDDGTRYYLDGVDADGKEVVIRTDKKVEIAVGDNFDLSNTKIRVDGNGTVRFYIQDDISLASGSNVTVPGQRSTSMWMYGTKNTDISIEGDSRFVGVVYATGQSGFTIKKSEVYGGIIAGEMEVGNGGSIHYDAALKTARTLPTDATVPRVTYLHISTTEISVEND